MKRGRAGPAPQPVAARSPNARDRTPRRQPRASDGHRRVQTLIMAAVSCWSSGFLRLVVAAVLSVLQVAFVAAGKVGLASR